MNFGETYEERAQNAEAAFAMAVKVVRQMYDAFWGTSESPGQDEANDAAKVFLDEYDA